MFSFKFGEIDVNSKSFVKKPDKWHFYNWCKQGFGQW